MTTIASIELGHSRVWSSRCGAHRTTAARRVVHRNVLRRVDERSQPRLGAAGRGHAARPRRNPAASRRQHRELRPTSCRDLAADLGCSVVVGHSTGATVALEMAASGGFRGPLVLLAPSFSRPGRGNLPPHPRPSSPQCLGRLPYVAMRAMFGAAVSGSPLPAPRRQALVAELRKNDPAFMHRGFHRYLQYLDAHRSVAPRLVSADVPAWVVHGESGDGGITEQERETLQAAPQITVVTLPGPSFFTQCEQPALVAQLMLDALVKADHT